MADAKKYIIDNPNLMKEWDWEKNNELGLDPNQLTSGSNKKAWWKCDKGHEWQTMINNRNNGRSCPYCSGRYVVKGENDLQTVNPTLAKEWNYEKNNGLTPIDVMPNSNKKVWWKCNNDHEWQATICNRNKGSDCPYCAGQKALKGKNDLQTINPTLAKEWNYEKNNELTPMDVTPNSDKKVWWKCAYGHEWQSTIGNRNIGNGCPYCTGKKVLKGYNDLQTVNPTLAKEWNYEKNNGLTPTDITPNSHVKVWWKCNKSHEWQARIASRNNGTGCPVCSSERNTSFPEYAIVFYLEKYGLETIHSYKEKGYELDVFIPSKNIAIEYDGGYWHKNKIKADLDKNAKCKTDGIKLYRIREGLLPLNDYSLDYIVQNTQKNLPTILEKVLGEILKMKINVDLERDEVEIENLREFTEKENSLLFSNPNIANEWNYEKNGNLKPEHFATNSNKKVWWKCINGHEWKATISNRNNGSACPYCSGQRVLEGYNDLQTTKPTLAKEWNYEKNNNLRPNMVTLNSGKKVWWKCDKGHEWQAVIGNRNKGRGCPYCANKKVLKGYNDLQTVNPTLAKEWNYEKNGDLKPIMVTYGSHKNIWWKCSHGHEWEATVEKRSAGRGCPYCSGRYVVQGENDLQTVNTILAKEWNYEKNNGLTPTDVLPNSNKNVWWKCSEGHEWSAKINHRNNGSACPQCAKEKRKAKYNNK